MKGRYGSLGRNFGRGLIILILSGLILIALPPGAAASPSFQSEGEGEALFYQQCASCHSIGGGIIVGPDLAGVFERRDSAWVREFIQSPDEILASDDPTAAEMLAEFNNVPMPNLGLTDSQVDALMVFLESGASVGGANEPLPPGKAERGAAFFTGEQRFENGGTPCIACHTVGYIGEFGGGNLGPDLTSVFPRYGKAGLASSIQNIAFPTMAGVYAKKPLTNQEVADLTTFFLVANANGNEGAANRFPPLLWGVGILGAGLLFGVMAIFWPRQKENLTDRLRRSAGIITRRDS